MNEFKPSQGLTVGTSLAKTPTGIRVLVLLAPDYHVRFANRFHAAHIEL